MDTQVRLGKDRLLSETVVSQGKDVPTGEEEPETRVPFDEDDLPAGKQTKTTPEMRAVFDLFTHNPARRLWRARPVMRDAAQVLHEEWGIEELTRRYKISQKYRGHEVCPQIDNPVDFLEKMPKMEKFLKTL